MAEMTVFLNGKLLPSEQATVSVLDRGFIFGDGIYELVPVYSRVPFRLEMPHDCVELVQRAIVGAAPLTHVAPGVAHDAQQPIAAHRAEASSSA